MQNISRRQFFELIFEGLLSKRSKKIPKVKVKKLSETAIIPEYKTNGSVGFDICSNVDAFLPPGGKGLLSTGIAVEIPKGYGLSIRQRSGLSVNYPNYLSIGVGTIDWDYRGEIKVPVVNNNDFDILDIKRGDRIAQGILHPVEQAEIVEVKKLSKTKRGKKGFGHTGVK